MAVKLLHLLWLGCLLMIMSVSGARASGVATTLEHKIAGMDTGVTPYLKQRIPAGAAGCGKGVVLFLHPFSVPTAQAFDVPGFSWMDHLAVTGVGSFALDFRGFGQSSRPPEMSQPPMANRPVVRAPDGVRDVMAAVDFIRSRCGDDRVDLIGWSWGAVVAGMYAGDHPAEVRRLVLFGAMHAFDLPAMTRPFDAPNAPGTLNPRLPAYQVVPLGAMVGHWDMMIGMLPESQRADIRSPEALAAVSAVFLGSDPSPPEPGRVRRPIGPLVDLYEIWSSRPLYDAARIKAPTLIVRGAHDEFADPGFVDRLSGVCERHEVVVNDATHWLPYERNRDQLLSAVDGFLASEAVCR